MTHFTMAFDGHWDVFALEEAMLKGTAFSWAGRLWGVQRVSDPFPDLFWSDMGGGPLPWADVLAYAAGLPLSTSWLWLQPYECLCGLAGIRLGRMGLSSDHHQALVAAYAEHPLTRPDACLMMPHPAHYFLSLPETYPVVAQPLHHLCQEMLSSVSLLSDETAHVWRREVTHLESLLMSVAEVPMGFWASGRTCSALSWQPKRCSLWSNGLVEQGLCRLLGQEMSAHWSSWLAEQREDAACFVSYYASRHWRAVSAEQGTEDAEAMVRAASQCGRIRVVYLSAEAGGETWCLYPDRWWSRLRRWWFVSKQKGSL